MIVGPDSILRRVPAVVDLEQRLRFEAVITALDILEYGYEQIERVLAHLGRKPEALSGADRTIIFAHAWSIVDQLYALLQLLKPFTELDTELGRFRAAAAPAGELRNYMDHLNTRLANLALVKSRRPPLFGTLSYFHCDEGDCIRTSEGLEIDKARVITVFSGLTKAKHSSGVLNPGGRGIVMPISQIELRAHDRAVNFDLAIASATALMESMEHLLESELSSKLPVLGADTGTSEEELRGTTGGGTMVVVLEIAFAAVRLPSGS